MFEVKVLDQKKKIAYLRWYGLVKKDEVAEATKQLNIVYEKFGKEKFYIIVNTKELKVFSPDTKDEIVGQQKWIADKLIEACDVVQSTLTKMQLQQNHKNSGIKNHITFFTSEEDALKYLNEKLK